MSMGTDLKQQKSRQRERETIKFVRGIWFVPSTPNDKRIRRKFNESNLMQLITVIMFHNLPYVVVEIFLREKTTS